MKCSQVLLALVLCTSSILAQDEAAEPTKPAGPMSEATFEGLAFRSIGPALTSGRIGDLAVNPRARHEYYVAVASGGVWKTTNAGTTWMPLFDDQASYSIGCITLDPRNPHTIWVGTGENNSQRSVGWGNGVYRSEDGGKSWKNMGLKNSEHVAKILIDHRSGNVVYVAAQGPLWASGGDRGLYKSTDGGGSWACVLSISPNTGVSDVVMDPRDPDVLYAASYQRRRHVWTLINGGPESAIHKSTDAGKTWRKLTSGLPSEDLGRIGLAISPVDPDIIYATVEAANNKSGFFRSTNRGATWEKRNDIIAGSPQYYGEIFCDPKDAGRVYLVDVFLKVTDDGGKTFRNVGEKYKHVDNHVVWIDPEDTDYLLVGCDGGLYESFDRGATWAFKGNLPVTQFYRVSVDNALPFYNVLGGTQDNFSLRGPSRTLSATGIENADWVVTNGGDGFESAIDPHNSDIVYAQSQYGGLVRFDARTGEVLGIKPQEGKGEPALRWNWDSPLLVSPHLSMRLYFAANRLFRSDDRGATWRPVSADLTRQIDRNKLPVMGRVWGIDAVSKNASTSFYGNCTALSESPRREGLIYVGTDDGLVQVTENGGESWTKRDRFPGVPEMTYVSRLEASRHAAGRVYAAFDNHKNGDFAPYLLRSEDAGASWRSIVGDLPSSGPVYALAEDPVNPDLLFAGTEFGVYFTLDAGKKWIRLKGGLPTIAVRDIAIQERECDLVLGTFGRGFYILDNYAPLRSITPETLAAPAHLFPVRDPLMFIPSTPYGGEGKAFQGDGFYAAENPRVGATLTYYLKETMKSLRELRQEAEKEKAKKGLPVDYPTPEQLRAEEEEVAPSVFLSIADEGGNAVRKLQAKAAKGIHRVRWDLRYPDLSPLSERRRAESPDEVDAPAGQLVPPGAYTVTLLKRERGVETVLAGPGKFHATPLGNATLPSADRSVLAAFQRKVANLQRAVLGASRLLDETLRRADLLQQALLATPVSGGAVRDSLQAIESRLRSLRRQLEGDAVLRDRNEPVPPSIVERVQGIVYDQWQSTSAPTATHETAYRIAGEEFLPLLEALRSIVEIDLRGLENRLERAGAPWTPGRVPEWKME